METISAHQQHLGRTASSVPSTVATLDFAQRTLGRLSLATVLEPARCLAEYGFQVSRLQRRECRWVAKSLSPETAAIFLGPTGVLQEGDLLRQPLLAATLRRLVETEAADFYFGGIASSIVRDMNCNGGFIGIEDLKMSAAPAIRKPIAGCYRGYRVITAPPPSGGLQLLLALEFLEKSGNFANVTRPGTLPLPLPPGTHSAAANEIRSCGRTARKPVKQHT
jgi:gamma-glutamyltranspeptidase/glutathione hydrolase